MVIGRGSRNAVISAGFFLCFFSISFLIACSAFAAEPDLEKANALMQEGKPAEAYSLLEPFEFEQAGNPKYDYLLGIAALDSGKPDKATLAFERVLAADPNFAGARLDMARAYFQLGDTARAKTEFETVLAQNPPEAARATVQRYLEAIAQREKAKQTVTHAYVEATLGHDSNVNNSTSQNQVIVPALGNLIFTLNPTNVSRYDYYGMMGAGAEIAHEVTPGFAVFAGADLRYRGNNREDQFDYKSFDARGGATYAKDKHIFRVTLSGGRYYLDNAMNRDTTAIAGDYRYSFNPSNQLSLFGQETQYRFSDTASLSTNNFNQSLLGAGWLRLLPDGRSALTAAVFGGTEHDLNGRADGGKDFTGLRIGGQLSVREKIDVFAAVGAQHGSYDNQNLSFEATRSDQQLDATLGAIWKFADVWSLRPQVFFIRNNSNIAIYTYQRTDVSVTLRRDF